jgi:hypothetical protein
LRVWCLCRAIYLIPTVELIEWLKDNFNLRLAIEIGAGNNYLHHHLGIKGIDNYSEQIPAVKQVHELMNQPSTNPPSEVENSNAIAAILKYQPETVITAWMTLKTEDPEGVDAGHKYAPDEKEILDTGVTYIHIANESIHSDRLIQLNIRISETTPKKIIGTAGINFLVLNHLTTNTTIKREIMIAETVTAH